MTSSKNNKISEITKKWANDKGVNNEFHLMIAYYLSKSLEIEFEFLKETLSDDLKKYIKDIIEKSKRYNIRISKYMDEESLKLTEEDSFQFLEMFEEFINKKKSEN